MNPRAVICWDFDETLGYFRPLEFAWLGVPASVPMPPPRLKPGIRELLESLDEFIHVVTTAAIAEYACEVLFRFGLRKCFAAVFGREHGICAAGAKDYSVVGARFSIDEAELPRRLVIVANDAKRDADCRCRQVVMIHDARMMDRPAGPLGGVLRSLARAGEGSIKRGFDRLSEFPSRELKCEYWGNYAQRRTYPVVSGLFAQRPIGRVSSGTTASALPA